MFKCLHQVEEKEGRSEKSNLCGHHGCRRIGSNNSQRRIKKIEVKQQNNRCTKDKAIKAKKGTCGCDAGTAKQRRLHWYWLFAETTRTEKTQTLEKEHQENYNENRQHHKVA